MWAVTSTFCPSSSANTYTTLPNALCFVIGQWHLYMQRKVPRLQLFLDFNSGSWGAWGWCILVGAAACSIPSNLSLLGLSLLGKREQITHLLWAQRQLITHCNLGMISSFLSPSLSPSLCLRASNYPSSPPLLIIIHFFYSWWRVPACKPALA